MSLIKSIGGSSNTFSITIPMVMLFRATMFNHAKS